jgi:glycosyltransferase involved in cell wall biosynthesis
MLTPVPKPLLVSVVTPTLNQARFLERTLESVRAQNYRPIEHVVIDGGSTDGTRDILKREANAGRLSYISEGDRGMYDAINKGLARTNGEIVGYLNSDDAWFPWAIETVIAAFKAHTDADVVFGDGVQVAEANGSQRLRIFPPFDRISLANYESVCQPAVFWRRQLYERIGGFDESMRFAADLDYWLRASASGSLIVHLNEVIAIERIHEQRLSSAHEEAMAVEVLAMRARHAGDRGGPDGRKRAVNRDERWQRWLWPRFITAFALRPLDSPWRRFLKRGGVSMDGPRVLAGSERRHRQLLWGAISSSLAGQILGAVSEGKSGPDPADRLLQRFRLLVLALPRLARARLALASPRHPVRRVVQMFGARVR